MLSSVTWTEASSVSTAPSGHDTNEAEQNPSLLSDMSLRQLLGKPLESGRTYVKEGNHEDQGVPRSVEGGESEMHKWLCNNVD